LKQIRKRLTYANVMSTIAVFLVIGGASALAAAQLAKNSVGTKQLKSNAVTTAKIKKEAVAAAKIKNGAVGTSKLGGGAVTSEKLGAAAVSTDKLANNAVTGAKVADGSITGADVNQGSLNAVKAANVYGVTFQEVGGPEIVNASDPGIKAGGCFIICAVEFPRDVTKCSYTTTSIDQGNGSGEAAMAEAFPGSEPNRVNVVMWNDEGNIIAHDFAMTVVCPSSS
jgi:hypothetical protein